MNGMKWVVVTTVAVTCLSFTAAADEAAGRSNATEAEWPGIARNQNVQPEPRVGPAEELRGFCKDPCFGGEGCDGWEVLWEQYCRSISSYSSECQPAASRYCARKIHSNVEDAMNGSQSLRTCQTCLY
jgi:hypothetical protein